MTQVRVVLADDHPVVLAGVEALLQGTPDLLVVGQATTGEALLDLMAEVRPDIAVIDISMPDMSGIELTRRALRQHPGVRVVALTMHEDKAYVQQILAAGACGYVLKRSAAEELVRAVRAVVSGGLFLDPAIAAKALAGSALPDNDDPPPVLSPREEDVLRDTARGLSNKEIAGRLDIGVKTVETYKARAVEKLTLRSRSDIVRYAARRGWLDGGEKP